MRILSIIAVTSALLTLTACGTTESKKQKKTSNTNITQVLYFHGKQRCITCNAIERLTKEVVDSLDNGRIVMTIIDISQRENEATADKYEVTWSALILDRNGKTENLTDIGFGYAKNQPQVFKTKLNEAITKIAD